MLLLSSQTLEVYFSTCVFLRCLFPAGVNPKFSRKDDKQFINMFLTIVTKAHIYLFALLILCCCALRYKVTQKSSVPRSKFRLDETALSRSIRLLKKVRKKLSYSLEESKFAFTQSIAYNYFTQALCK